MKPTSFVVATFLATSCASVASGQQVSLTLNEGRVSLRAENATIRQILAEWERLGQVRIVGVDRLAASQPLTLTLADVSERQALDIVLRGVPGYMVVDRLEPTPGTSRYDRLVLLAKTTTPTPAVASNAGASVPTPAQPYAPTMDSSQANTQMPDRSDVDQFDDANAEPPMPNAPVVNPYPSGAPGSGGSNAGGANTNVLSSGTSNVNVQPPETQFDYANPQRYFDRMRQMQTQAGQQPAQQGQQPTAVYPGTTTQTPTTTPTATPSATGTLAQPGIAPAPATPPQQQGVFNPYNLPPDQLQGNPTTTTTTPTTTPVQPDRSKYANPYQPAPTSKPPQ
jgi:hypothetical protein